MPLPPGEEPKLMFWYTSLTVISKDSSSSSEEDYPRKCLDECRKNCTSDGGRKCFGKVHHSELNPILFYTLALEVTR